MKAAPHFVKWPDPVHGMWKIDLLDWLGKITGLKTLIETGTCEGVTPFFLRNDFEAIHTLELHDGLFQTSVERLRLYPHIHCYHGSSRTMLEPLLENTVPAGPLLFWLDAHSSGPHTANDGNPLPDELRVITKLRPESVIVIDDMMGLNEFLGQVGDVDLSDWQIEYRTGEIVMHKKGLYNIPAFEDGLWTPS
jgi:hypothetical protein